MAQKTYYYSVAITLDTRRFSWTPDLECPHNAEMFHIVKAVLDSDSFTDILQEKHDIDGHATIHLFETDTLAPGSVWVRNTPNMENLNEFHPQSPWRTKPIDVAADLESSNQVTLPAGNYRYISDPKVFGE